MEHIRLNRSRNRSSSKEVLRRDPGLGTEQSSETRLAQLVGSSINRGTSWEVFFFYKGGIVSGK